MAEKRKKRKRKGKASGSSGGSGAQGGGVMQGIRSGFRRAAGAEQSSGKPSKLSNAIWTILLLAAVAFLLYRWYG